MTVQAHALTIILAGNGLQNETISGLRRYPLTPLSVSSYCSRESFGIPACMLDCATHQMRGTRTLRIFCGTAEVRGSKLSRCFATKGSGLGRGKHAKVGNDVLQGGWEGAKFRPVVLSL